MVLEIFRIYGTCHLDDHLSFQMKSFFDYRSPNNLVYAVLSENTVLFQDRIMVHKQIHVGLNGWNQNVVHVLC